MLFCTTKIALDWNFAIKELVSELYILLRLRVHADFWENLNILIIFFSEKLNFIYFKIKFVILDWNLH